MILKIAFIHCFPGICSKDNENRAALTAKKCSPSFSLLFWSLPPSCSLFWLPVLSCGGTPFIFSPVLVPRSQLSSLLLLLFTLSIRHLVHFSSRDPSKSRFHLLSLSSLPFPLTTPFLSPLAGCVSACIVLPPAPALSAIRGPGERTLAQISIL